MNAAYHPVMLTKVLVHAYCVGVFSSRKIQPVVAHTWRGVSIIRLARLTGGRLQHSRVLIGSIQGIQPGRGIKQKYSDALGVGRKHANRDREDCVVSKKG